MASCFVYKVIRDVELMGHLCIKPILRMGFIQGDLSIRISSSCVHKLVFD